MPALWHDERAIEGLPIRLVIALVVGVAALAVMMNVIAGFDGLGSTELDTKPEPEIIDPGQETVNVTVVDPNGEAIANATVVASGNTATLPSITTATTGPNGTATLTVDPELGPNQERGTLTLDVRPPEGDYVDEQENTDILVVEG
jgi:hypothetical protein